MYCPRKACQTMPWEISSVRMADSKSDFLQRNLPFVCQFVSDTDCQKPLMNPFFDGTFSNRFKRSMLAPGRWFLRCVHCPPLPAMPFSEWRADNRLDNAVKGAVQFSLATSFIYQTRAFPSEHVTKQLYDFFVQRVFQISVFSLKFSGHSNIAVDLLFQLKQK